MIKTTNEKNDLRRHYTFGMPLLKLMLILAVAGIVVAVLLKLFLG